MADEGIIFPLSKNIVRVRMVDTTTHMTVRAESFIEPVQPGHGLVNITDVAFLVEHEGLGQKVMFDLGVRKDYWNFPPVLQKRLGVVIPSLRVEKDVTEILEENSVDLGSISSVIWSHYHWDHTGNVSLFPSSTSLVVGPGVESAPNLLPGFPETLNSPLSAADFKDRDLVEIDFAASNLEVGGFRAHDFFGDGSFYLLDTPGHCIGHVCGLARTTPDPNSTFIFMGGDICHFAGDFRPTPSIPLPDSIPSGVLDNDPSYFHTPCPCSLFTDHHPKLSFRKPPSDVRTTPFYNVSTSPTSAYVDPPTAQKSVNELAHLEASPAVFVCLAHDGALLQHLPIFNDDPSSDLNDWKSNGWKEKCHWGWLNELPRAGKPGRKPIVEGFWRDGHVWEQAKSELRKLGERAAGSGL